MAKMTSLIHDRSLSLDRTPLNFILGIGGSLPFRIFLKDAVTHSTTRCQHCSNRTSFPEAGKAD